MTMLKMSDVDLAGRRVLIREDLNVPMENGRITSDTRIRSALPTIESAREAGARVLVVSHLGRPTEGVVEEKFSLAPVARELGRLLGREVRLAEDWIDGVEIDEGEVVLAENVRFLEGEKGCDDSLSRRMAALCDVFVMDAFATAHRAQASTYGVAAHAPLAVAGPLLASELEALEQGLENPAQPMVAVVGGSKVSTKLTVLEALAGRVDRLILGGGIANTFIAAAGHEVGRSLHEPGMVEDARRLAGGGEGRAEIPLPSDVVVASEFSATAEADVKSVDGLAGGDMIMDIGPDTAAAFADVIAAAGTVVWNGPVGVFEFDQFGEGTRVLAEAIAASDAYSIAGGGDTLAAIEKYGVAEGISYISTGGGAFLEFLEGKKLPAVAVLESRAAEAADGKTANAGPGS